VPDLLKKRAEHMDLTQAAWRKSTYSGSGSGNCVEVASNLPGLIAVRDSKYPHGPALTFSTATWFAFLRDINAGHPRVAGPRG
jgi:Domain of unknown function (DUF397)